MYFDEDEDALFNPDLYHVVRRELYTLSSNLENTPYGLRSVPTHTEDGIPIRKLYVTNLPPKTTRTELFGVFAQYGFIRSCWLRMTEKGLNKSPIPTYAFVTFSDPADAHKALLAPAHEKILRGRTLRTSPADTWHQPVEDGEIKICWKPKTCQEAMEERNKANSANEDINQENGCETSTAHCSSNNANNNNTEEDMLEKVDIPCDYNENYRNNIMTFDILEVLNRDCLHHVFSYVPIRDLIRSEPVSKGWQNSVQEYLDTVRLFKTSWWQHVPVTLTTAVLRQVLQRLGALQRLHIDHHWSALNDRTAHTIGKFCPALEELKVVGMHTKNWNPLIYGCKNLKHLSFVSCNKLTDSSLVHIVKPDSTVESMTIANNTHVTGLFLTGANPMKLTSLSFYNCYSLQGTVLSAALESLPNLKCLRLDVCPVTMWKIIPLIIKKLPKLEELSLSEYTSIELCFVTDSNNMFCEAMANLTELRVLNLSRNIYITNAVLKQVGQSCLKLESLNISGCNARKGFPHPLGMSVPGTAYPGVGDEGLAAVCAGCVALRKLDVSYLGAVTDAGLAPLTRLRRLRALFARGNGQLSAQPFSAALAACHELQEVDLCGCDGVTEEVVAGGVRALRAHPRRVTLRLAGTAASPIAPNDQAVLARCSLPVGEYPKHKLLRVDLDEDRSNPQLRPDFDDGSDESLHDMYDDDFDGYMDHGDVDDFFMHHNGDFEDYEGLMFGLNAPIILL